ncbi:hypothetical protein Tco_1360959 [Tanacetum coccineum]
MGTPTQVCVWSCPNFSAPAGRPFRCVSDIWLLISGDAKSREEKYGEKVEEIGELESTKKKGMVRRRKMDDCMFLLLFSRGLRGENLNVALKGVESMRKALFSSREVDEKEIFV